MARLADEIQRQASDLQLKDTAKGHCPLPAPVVFLIWSLLRTTAPMCSWGYLAATKGPPTGLPATFQDNTPVDKGRWGAAAMWVAESRY